MASEQEKMRRTTILSAIVSLVAFGYKMYLGVITASLVLMIAAVSTLMVFICKLTFVFNATQTFDKKVKGYFIMFVATAAYSAIFILFVVLQIFGINISNQNTFEGWLGVLYILILLIMFLLSVAKLRGALERSDIMVIGLKEMTFVSACADMVIISEFIGRIVMYYYPSPLIDEILYYVPLALGAIMVITSLTMLRRFLKCRQY